MTGENRGGRGGGRRGGRGGGGRGQQKRKHEGGQQGGGAGYYKRVGRLRCNWHARGWPGLAAGCVQLRGSILMKLTTGARNHSVSAAA